MKKLASALIAICTVLTMAGCSQQADETAEWSRDGYFQDENGNYLSVVFMEEIDEPGWYVGCMLGQDPTEDSWGGTVAQEGNTLHGTLMSSGSRDDLTVTVAEEGEDGLVLTVEGGETYHFKELDIPEATIFVTINTEGWGYIDQAEGEEAPEIDTEYPFQSAVVNLAEPATYTFIAWPQAGNFFVKWTKNGEDFSTEPVITLLLDESADYIAVFEEDPDWQNPVTDYAGDYQCDRARATVETFGFDEAFVTVEWANSASEVTRWYLSDRFDPETRTVTYDGGTKVNLTFDGEGEVTNEDRIYDDGTGTIVFDEDGTFTWHEDQSDKGEDMVFERMPAAEE